MDDLSVHLNEKITLEKIEILMRKYENESINRKKHKKKINFLSQTSN